MSRNMLIASLAGALALGVSALSAQAASLPMSGTDGNVSLVQKTHYRHHRHHHHQYYGYYYRHHHHHHHHFRHHHRYS